MALSGRARRRASSPVLISVASEEPRCASGHQPPRQNARERAQKIIDDLIAQLSAIKPAVETQNQHFQVVWFGAKPAVSRGRPKKSVNNKLIEAIWSAINNKHFHHRSGRAITEWLISDQQSGYCGRKFDTLDKRVRHVVNQQGQSLWDLHKDLHRQTLTPSDDLLWELGLQSLGKFRSLSAL